MDFGLFQGILRHMSGMANMARRSAGRRRAGANRLSSNIVPDDDDEYDSDVDGGDERVDDDDAGQKCAACFRIEDRNRKWRRLVTLPCCGTNGREANSSTRFCAACMLKLAVTRPSHSPNSGEYRAYDDEPDEYPAKKFYQKKNLQNDNRRFCECPRCRDVLLVKINGVRPASFAEEHGDDDDGDSTESDDYCDCPDCEAERRERKANRKGAKTARSISLRVPSFKAKCWYAGRKRGVAGFLWRASMLHNDFMPLEALGGEDERATVERLIGWGIIEKGAGTNNVNGNSKNTVYRMDVENQRALIKFFRLKDPISEKDRKSEESLTYDLGARVGYSAWRHLREERRVDRAARMVNRFFLIGLHFNGNLPPLPLSWRQEVVVSALIIFSLALAVQFACVLIVYALAFFGVGLSVCYALRRSNSIRSSWWICIIVSYFAYRLNDFFYQSPYLKWSVLVSPKAMVPVKKILWG